jgi:SulP family sulfate permease
MQRHPDRAGTIAGNLRGGLANAAVSVGILLPLGLLSFAALGSDAAGVGVRAALVSTAVGGFIATLFGGMAIPGTNPRTSTSLVFAGFVATLAADPRLGNAGIHDLPTILALTSLCTGLAGLLQIAFGLLRLGSVVKFVPLPVVAGFMDGIAILVAVAQVRPLLGLQGPWSGDLAATFRHVETGGLALGLGTAVFAWAIARRWPRAPWALVGLVVGTAVYMVAERLFADLHFGPRLGSPSAGVPLPTVLLPLLSPGIGAALAAHWRELVTASVVIAVIGSMDALLSAVSMDTLLNTRHDSNRFLLGYGLANVAAAAFGGIPINYSTAVPLAIHRAGGHGRVPGVVGAAVLALILLVGGSVLGLIPVTVSAGIMLVVALGMFDQWSRIVWREVRSGGRDRDALWSLAVVVIVGLITIVFGFVVSIAAGVLLSLALFIVTMNRSLVRGSATGASRASRRIYFPDQARLLREQGHRIKFLELEGAVFFGTAETLSRQVEQLAADARFVILDVRRVTTIDASGAMALDRLSRQLAARGVPLLLAGIVSGDRHARALRAAGAFLRGAEDTWFVDADRALEHAERRLLDEAGVQPPDVELPVDQLSLLQDLDPEQKAALRRRLDRVELAAGETLFRENEPGDRVYVLARGSVSVLSGVSGDRAAVRRLASFTPGVIFGETAMLDGGGRTATAVADEPSVVYVLTRASLDAIRAADPALASLVLLNLAKQLSARLRFAAATIQAADY